MSPILFPSSKEDIVHASFFNESWYYSIELVPGLFTRGANHRNLGLTRNLLSKCQVTDRRCLDIGTMEAAVPVLLSRRGAGSIVAVDVGPCPDRIEAVKHYTGARFDYYAGLTHGQTIPFLRDKGATNFDIVILSGVLYHCFGPLHTLAVARSLVRTGGLLIVETFAAVDDQYAMFFNARGVFTRDPSSYFLPSVPLLDYILRYFKLAPIDCVHGGHSQVGRYQTARVAIACRATNEVVAKNDAWMDAATGIVDYVTLIEWGLIEKSGVNPPAFESPAAEFLQRDTESCDVIRTVLETRPLDLPESVAMIRLTDQY
jgi:SAM-dependent methyltransferase